MNEHPTDEFGEDFGATKVVRAWEPPEEVVIPKALAQSSGLDFDDYGVLIRLMLRDPAQPSSVLGLLEEFRAGGWTLGEKTLRQIMKRLKAAGHVQHSREYNKATKRPEWVFRVYRNPANNEAYVSEGLTAFPQVSPIGPVGPDRTPESSADRDLRSGCAGQADRDLRSGSAPIGTLGPDRKAPVSAGQADRDLRSGSDAPPPHPPEGVTTPPYPRKKARGSQEEGEGLRFAQEDIDAATGLLQRLGHPWTIGKQSAEKLAPKLLAVMATQNWPSIQTVNSRLLTAQLTKNPKGVTNPFRLLASDRIPDLPLYEVVARAVAPQRAVQPAGAVECAEGCDEGWLTVGNAVKACGCMSTRATPSAL